MTRPSRNIDKLLLQAGKELIPKTGISGLSVRQVSAKAGVNLGMFNYHFKTKEKFIECLMKEIYEEFFKNFQIESETGNTSIERLRNVLVTIAKFVKEHREIIVPFLEEVLHGNLKLVEFARNNMIKHVFVMITLVKRCQKDGYIAKIPLINVFPPLMAAIVGPIIVSRVVNKYVKTGIIPKLIIGMVQKNILSDKSVEQRIDIVLKGLAAVEVK